MKDQINKTIVAMMIVVSFSFALFFPHQALSETISYVSDELTIPLRSGTSDKHRIFRFLKSGTALKVLEVSDDGNYSRVTDPDGKEGWVKNSDLMSRRSASDRLVSANEKLAKTRAMVKELKKTIAKLQAESKELSSQLKSSKKQGSTLEGDIAYLKKVTANPLALANKNKALEEEINTVTRLNVQLKNENKRLSDQSTKEWFILGAAVSLGSLLFGLLITRIRWQKKSSWGGSSL